MKEDAYPRLILPDWFDQRINDEAPITGYLSHLETQLENGNRYLLYFIDPMRLNQELEIEIKHGRPFFAEKGLVVLPEVTVKNIRRVLKQLLKDGFFDSLKPL